DPVALRALLEVATDPPAAEQAAGKLAGCARLFVTGTGIDLVSARELALKVEEGAGVPATALHTEEVRHGHLAAAGPETGIVLVLTHAEPAGEPVRERARPILRPARALQMPAVAILGARVGADVPAELTTAGRMTPPEPNRT